MSAEPTPLKEPFMVSSKTNPTSLASAIVQRMDELQENGMKLEVTLQAIGAGAVNQANKGWAIARGYVGPRDKDILGAPAFISLLINGEDRTGMKFRLNLTDNN
jgi:stage V sporulation protein S